MRIPHAEMVSLRNKGLLNLGIDNSTATTISGLTNLGPQKTAAAVAFKFWAWIGVGIFIWSVYWSFTKNWWWFIAGFVVTQIIWSANKKSNAENFLDAAMVDKEFYDRILAVDGWIYQFEQSTFPKLEQFISKKEN